MQSQLGEIIRKYRKQKGYTMTQLAARLGISMGLLSNIETGKSSSLQLTLLNNIVKELDIPVSELELFSEPYPIEDLSINLTKDYNKIKSSLEKLINAFIRTSSELSYDENKVDIITNMLIKELQTISLLIGTAKSER